MQDAIDADDDVDVVDAMETVNARASIHHIKSLGLTSSVLCVTLGQ